MVQGTGKRSDLTSATRGRSDPYAATEVLRPATKTALADHLVSRLREAIIRGYFRPGEHLKEAQLAAQFNVSRGPVREALVQLEREGVVTSEPNKAARVAHLSRTDVDEVYKLRLALERLAVELAVENGSVGDFQEMTLAVDAYRAATRGPITASQAADFDVEFHDLIYKAARHRRLWEAWLAIRSQVHLFLLSRNVVNRDFKAIQINEHRAIISVLQKRNVAEATQAIEEHLRGAYERLLASYEGGHGLASSDRESPT